MNVYDRTNDDGSAAGPVVDINDLSDFAFKVNGTFLHAWRFDGNRSCQSQPSVIELVEIRRRFNRRGIHGTKDMFSDDIHDKFICRTNVVHCIFYFSVRPANQGTKKKSWRIWTDRVKERKRSKVRAAAYVNAGDPAKWSRTYRTGESFTDD